VPQLVAQEFVPWLAKLTDRLQRDFLSARMAELTGISQAQILASLTDPANARYLAAVEKTRAPKPTAAAAHAPLAPLPTALFDLYGHLFHARPGELDGADLETFLRTETRLEPEWLALGAELAQALAAGRAPSELPRAEIASAAHPDVARLLDRLAASAAAFATTARAAQIQKVKAHVATLKVRETIQRLKAQLPLVARSPDKAAELAQLLKTIGELTKTLSAPPPA
jgi:hypothetical protein